MAGRPSLRAIRLDARRAGHTRIQARADEAMHKGDGTHMFIQELARRDGNDKWMVTFAQTNDGHMIHHNDKTEWDIATTIHKDISSAAENKHIINDRHWQIISYTMKATRYIIANCHLPTFWQPA